MRETRLSGSEGGGTGNLTGPPYPYHLETGEPAIHAPYTLGGPRFLLDSASLSGRNVS